MEYQGRDGIYTQHLIIPWNIKGEMGSIQYTTSYYPMEYQGRDGIYTQHLIIPWNVMGEMESIHTQHLNIHWNIKGDDYLVEENW